MRSGWTGWYHWKKPAGVRVSMARVRRLHPDVDLVFPNFGIELHRWVSSPAIKIVHEARRSSGMCAEPRQMQLVITV